MSCGWWKCGVRAGRRKNQRIQRTEFPENFTITSNVWLRRNKPQLHLFRRLHLITSTAAPDSVENGSFAQSPYPPASCSTSKPPAATMKIDTLPNTTEKICVEKVLSKMESNSQLLLLTPTLIALWREWSWQVCFRHASTDFCFSPTFAQCRLPTPIGRMDPVRCVIATSIHSDSLPGRLIFWLLDLAGGDWTAMTTSKVPLFWNYFLDPACQHLL